MRYSIFDVHRIEVSAHSLDRSEGHTRMHYQRLELFDAQGWRLGDIVLHLQQPLSALAVGDCSQLDGFQDRINTDASASGVVQRRIGDPVGEWESTGA